MITALSNRRAARDLVDLQSWEFLLLLDLRQLLLGFPLILSGCLGLFGILVCLPLLAAQLHKPLGLGLDGRGVRVLLLEVRDLLDEFVAVFYRVRKMRDCSLSRLVSSGLVHILLRL